MTYGCKIMVSLTLCGFFGLPCMFWRDSYRLYYVHTIYITILAWLRSSKCSTP